MPISLAESYRFCRDVAKTRAKNFYYSFLLLDKPRREAMCAVYAFMRYCDDLSDEPASGGKANIRHAISQWRRDLNRALAGDYSDHPVWPAFHDTVQRYSIPHRFFHEMIDGITSDLEPRRIQTFEELYKYCYQVASVVGLTVIHIFGFTSPKALLLAEKCGIAFQLTNILRDIREDAEVDRIYVPAEDLERFGVTFEQLRTGQEDENFRQLMQFETKRAKEYYDESAPLSGLIEKQSRTSLWALRAIYLKLLGRIENSGYSVLSHRLNVPTRTKVLLLVRALVFRKT